jgi:3-hydroxyacyl-[acyl-carrier-protein] dehydratase
MRFNQLDRIVTLEPKARIVAERVLTGREDYLKDHFPQFPVMPGVLMLEALFQAAAWLVYATEEFRYPVVVLKEARNIRFADFVEPGEVLTVTAEVQRWDWPLVTCKANATVGESVAVSGRLVLERFCMQDRYRRRIDADNMVRHELQTLFKQLLEQRP